jgi:hypothetical protein
MSKRANKPGPCAALCPHDNPCACSGKAHTLHVCADETCACHGQGRYALEAGKMVYWRSTYRRGGVRVVLVGSAPGGMGWLEVDRP